MPQDQDHDDWTLILQKCNTGWLTRREDGIHITAGYLFASGIMGNGTVLVPQGRYHELATAFRQHDLGADAFMCRLANRRPWRVEDEATLRRLGLWTADMDNLPAREATPAGAMGKEAET